MSEAEIAERIRDALSADIGKLREALSADIRKLSDTTTDLNGRVAALERGEQSTSKDLSRVEGKVDGMDQRIAMQITSMSNTLAKIQESITRREGVVSVARWIGNLVQFLAGGVVGAAVVHFLNWH